jgi:class 3 adenylate cyclase
MAETPKIAAILVADVVGYSRLAGADEDRTLSRLRGLRSDLIDPAIAAHHGRIVKRTGDGRARRPLATGATRRVFLVGRIGSSRPVLQVAPRPTPKK